MSSASLSQEEADRLLAMEKVPSDDNIVDFIGLVGTLSIELSNYEEREKFILDYRQSSINLKKRNHQVRGRQVVILARLDLDGLLTETQMGRKSVHDIYIFTKKDMLTSGLLKFLLMCSKT